MTPSRIGRMTMMLPGMRPSICGASRPTATTRVVAVARGDDGRLVDDDAAALDVDEHVGRAEVDADALRQHASPSHFLW